MIAQTIQRNQYSPGMHLPMACVYASVTVGLIFGVIRGIQVLVDWTHIYILKKPAKAVEEGTEIK